MVRSKGTLGSSLKLICGGDRESGPPGPLLPVVDRRGTTSDLSDVNLQGKRAPVRVERPLPSYTIILLHEGAFS